MGWFCVGAGFMGMLQVIHDRCEVHFVSLLLRGAKSYMYRYIGVTKRCSCLCIDWRMHDRSANAACHVIEM
jgi:hypothetical protein